MSNDFIVSDSICRLYESEFKSILKNTEKTKCLLKGIYEFAKNKCKSNSESQYMDCIYADKCKNLLNDLRDSNNETAAEILSNIKNNKINAYDIAFYSPVNMNKKNWEKIVNRIETSENKLSDLPTVEWGPCKVCKGKNFFYRTEQTRSADEPETVFYTCKTCERVYRFNN